MEEISGEGGSKDEGAGCLGSRDEGACGGGRGRKELVA